MFDPGRFKVTVEGHSNPAVFHVHSLSLKWLKLFEWHTTMYCLYGPSQIRVTVS